MKHIALQRGALSPSEIRAALERLGEDDFHALYTDIVERLDGRSVAPSATDQRFVPQLDEFAFAILVQAMEDLVLDGIHAAESGLGMSPINNDNGYGWGV
ncbi:MAG: hypothetical protein IT290_08745 [Deltaproteobacteria bacterium]|nr:hypothetical protein [Deltaproteobacteria bacterium]